MGVLFYFWSVPNGISGLLASLALIWDIQDREENPGNSQSCCSLVLEIPGWFVFFSPAIRVLF